MNDTPGYYRFKLGDFDVVAVHEGVVSFDRPPGFVLNADTAAVGEAFAEAGMPQDKLTLTFTTLAIDTGSGVAVIDSGFGAGGPPGTGRLLGNLAAAGVAAADVTDVLVSHFHGDHITGLRQADGGKMFPNARLSVPQPEWEFWMDDSRADTAAEGLRDNFRLARRIFGPEADAVRRFAWGEEVLPGIVSVQAEGHTPGMSGFEIASGGERLLFVADITNNPLIFARRPTWQAMFDMDPEAATATRRRLLDRAAAERLPLFFFHAPFPGLGTVVKSGDGYEYLPALWRQTNS